MDTTPERLKGDGVISSLNVTIEALNLAKDISGITPAKVVFGSVSALLTMIRDSMVNQRDYVELGLNCADVCRALERGTSGKKLDDLSQSVYDAINQLTIAVAEIQRKVIKRNGRNTVTRLFNSKNDKETVTAWKLDLNRILHVFNTELILNTHVTVSDMRHDVSRMRSDMSEIREEISGQFHSSKPSALGESPPPLPRACFGRGELIEKIVGLAKDLTPIALIGAGGIGKTSIALAVLHNDRIKKRFGDNRRFIRCDQFPPSRAHFLNRLSEVIGAGVENPKDLTPLRPFLSSREMILFLDNAESILDPQGKNAQEIYATVEELIQFNNVCLCFTSRISTIPPTCEPLEIPTLSIEAARDVFYRIHKNCGQPGPIDGILGQLDFHPLSITLLATVAHHNKWDVDRLTREWGERRTDVLRTRYNNSLATTIELSLASPMFQELGPDARGLLGVVAFFPQGINENNLDWLFPVTPDRTNIFDNFCVLSLTYRSNGFITMLAPLRDYLSPKNPASSPLLRTTMDSYFHRLAVAIHPGRPGFEEAQWITSEDVNVEHLLDVFTSIDPESTKVWSACSSFMGHLYWHKRRLVTLGPKIEGLPDEHPTKPECLFQLSRLFDSVGNRTEYKRLLTYTLKLWRERGDDGQVAQTLRFISNANGLLGFQKEGIRQAKESLEICERLNNVHGQAQSWQRLASMLFNDRQFNAAGEAASRAIDLLSDGSDQFSVCKCYRVLGYVYRSKGEIDQAIKHFETALGIATTFNWRGRLFWIHHSLAGLFYSEHRFDEAHAHVEHAKSHATNDPYQMARAMELQAKFWHKQCRFKEARAEALRAAEVYEKLGATKDMQRCGTRLMAIDGIIDSDKPKEKQIKGLRK